MSEAKEVQRQEFCKLLRSTERKGIECVLTELEDELCRQHFLPQKLDI